MDYQTIEVDGKIYYYNGDLFFDEYFIVLQGVELQRVCEEYYKNVDYTAMKAGELIDFARVLRNKGLFAKSKEVMDYGLKKFEESSNFIQWILPVYTSCCRDMGRSAYAIELAESFFDKIEPSAVLCTSLAAACCDIRNYEKAKRYARMAYAKQGGGLGHQNELSLVFKRLEKETGEAFFYEDEN